MINATSRAVSDELAHRSVNSFTQLALLAIVLLGVVTLEYQVIRVTRSAPRSTGGALTSIFMSVAVPITVLVAVVVASRFLGMT